MYLYEEVKAIRERFMALAEAAALDDKDNAECWRVVATLLNGNQPASLILIGVQLGLLARDEAGSIYHTPEERSAIMKRAMAFLRNLCDALNNLGMEAKREDAGNG